MLCPPGDERAVAHPTLTWNPLPCDSPPLQKYWITNASVHAQWAVVFAQLTVGSTPQGIHGFLVR